MLVEKRTTYRLVYCCRGCDTYVPYDDQEERAICGESLRELFPAAGKALDITFSAHPLEDITTSAKFEVYTKEDSCYYRIRLKLGDKMFGQLHFWLQHKADIHRNIARQCVYIGVENVFPL